MEWEKLTPETVLHDDELILAFYSASKMIAGRPHLLAGFWRGGIFYQYDGVMPSQPGFNLDHLRRIPVTPTAFIRLTATMPLAWVNEF